MFAETTGMVKMTKIATMTNGAKMTTVMKMAMAAAVVVLSVLAMMMMIMMMMNSLLHHDVNPKPQISGQHPSTSAHSL